MELSRTTGSRRGQGVEPPVRQQYPPGLHLCSWIFFLDWGFILVQLRFLYKFRVLYLVLLHHFPTWLFPCYTIYLQLPTAIIWSIWQSKRKSEMHFEVLVISQPLSSHSKLCEGLTGSCDFLRYMMYHFDRHVCSHQTQNQRTCMPYNIFSIYSIILS